MKLSTIKPYLKKSKTYSDGTFPIYISIIKNRKQSLVSIGYSVPPEAWNELERRVYESKPRISPMQKATLTEGELAMLKEEYSNALVLYNAKTINAEIENRLAELTLLQNKIRANEEDLDSKILKKQYTLDPDLDRNKNFIAFGEESAAHLLKAGQIGTSKRYKTILKRLSTHLKGKPLQFKELTVNFLKEYELHLKQDGLKTNTIHNNLKTIRAIYYSAVKEQLIPQDKNPFVSFKLKIDKNIKKAKLTIEEIKSLQNLELPEHSKLWHCRNYFIFSFNVAGIRVGDLIQLKWEHITKEGRLEYNMDKTGGFKSIQLSENARRILNYYFHDQIKPENFIFPLLDNSVDYSDKVFLFNQVSSKTTMINNCLKDLAQLAKIDKSLSSHIARHSFSDIARKKKVNVYDIKNMLGHSSLKMTENYLASLDYDSQDETMNNILNF